MKTILIVEDEQDVRSNLEDLLEAEGFGILSAKNGKEGYEIAATKKPDLILSDIYMPEMDGMGLLKKLQENEVTSLIPFIFLTAKTEINDMREGMIKGADDYMLKPFKIDDVLNAINSRLKKKERILAEINEFKNTLIKRVPHELRTPLVGILGFSNIIYEDIDNLSKGEIKEMTDGILRSGKRLHRRIEKFITYTGLMLQNPNDNNEAQNELNEYEINPGLLSARLLDKAADFGRSNDLKLQFEKSKMKISELNFETMLNELLENSLKFSKRNNPIFISGQPNGEYYITKIIDSESGVNKIEFNNINPFNKFGKEGLTDEGLGLGLAIVKIIVERARGYITFGEIDNITGDTELGIPLKKENCLF